MRCPNCGHEQIPSDTCARCGIVFSKYSKIQKLKIKTIHLKESATLGEVKTFSLPAKTSKIPAFLADLICKANLPWNPVPTLAMIAFSTGFAVVIYLLATFNHLETDSMILIIILKVDLVFHEAGHWIFGIFGYDTLTILGGSLNQVLIPLIVAVAFWRQRDTAGFAFGLFWMFENFIGVAAYMADARALELPLLGGMGEESHDWRNLFLYWNLLAKDTLIAQYTRNVGWFGIYSTWAWLIWRWFLSKEKDSRASCKSPNR